MATLTVTLTAADGTSRAYSLPVTIDRPLYPGRATFPGPTTFPGK